MLCLILWHLIVVLPTALSSMMLQTQEEDVLSLTQAPVTSLLEDSLEYSCSLIFFTDGSTSSSTVSQIMQNTSNSYFSSYMEAQPKKGVDSTYDILSVAEMAEEIKRVSPCLTILLVSDDLEFLLSAVKISVAIGLMIQPTRLMILTRVQPADLQPIYEDLSKIDAIVVFFQTLLATERCRVFMYIPYSLRRMQIASWTPKEGLVYTGKKNPFPDKFSKMIDGAHVTAAVRNFLPHVILTENVGENGETEVTLGGPVNDVISLLAKNVNFTYSLMPSDSYGYLLPNGTWNGQVGVVHRKEADLALGPLAITYGRSRVVVFTVPLIIDYLIIQGRRGGTEVDPWSFVLPFTLSVWAWVFASYAAAVITSFVFRKLNWSTSSGGSFFMYHRILMHQDIDESLLSWWEKMIIGGWILTVMVSGESYSGNLMSLLAVRHISMPHQSFRAVLDDPKIKMMWVSDTVYVQRYKSAKSGILREVAESESIGKITYIPAKDFRKSMNTREDHVSVFPFVSARVFLTESYTDKGDCRFYVSKEKYLPFTFTLIVQFNSPLLQGLNHGVQGIVEGGLYEYWLERSVPMAKGCVNPPTKVTVKSSLSIADLFGMFVLLLSGYGISIFGFVLELMMAAISSRVKKDTD